MTPTQTATPSADKSVHTPGPWSYSGMNTDMYVMARRGRERIRVAEVICNDDLTPDETDANKTLIADAPKTAAERDKLREQVKVLLAACKAIVESIEQNEIESPLPHKEEMLRAAIAKVEGEQ